MKKRNIFIGLGIIAVLVVIAYFSIIDKNRRSTLNISESAFSIEDTATIDKIFIASKFGWKALLEKRSDKEWILNSKYKVNRMQLGILLKTLHWQTIKRPVHAGEREMVIKNIATKGLKVEVYQNGDKTKVFYVGGDANDSKGTYFIMEGSENPFVVYMPNHTGFLSPRYVVKEENYRHTQLFKSDLLSFKEIKVDYPSNPSEGFIIKNENSKPELLGIDNFNLVAVNNYISNYKRIHITRFVEDEKGIKALDSLRAYKPSVVISVEDQNSAYSNSIQLFQTNEDPDGMYGIANMEGDERYVAVQNYVFNKLLVPASAFRMPEEN